MQHHPLTTFCHADLSGQVAGNDPCTWPIAQRLQDGTDRTPNTQIFATRTTVTPGEWGSHGDMMPRDCNAAGVAVATPEERLDLRSVAVVELRAETGLTQTARFEFAAILTCANARTADNDGRDAIRRSSPIDPTGLPALHTAGVHVNRRHAALCQRGGR